MFRHNPHSTATGFVSIRILKSKAAAPRRDYAGTPCLGDVIRLSAYLHVDALIGANFVYLWRVDRLNILSLGTLF